MLALVVGTATCVWDDLSLIGSADLVYVINLMGLDYPGVPDFWVVAGKQDEANRLAFRRKNRGLGAVHQLVGWQTYASAPLYAADHAFRLGADRVVLAGVPLVEDIGHYYKPGPALNVEDFRGAWKDWMATHPEASRVRSCSGWTREILGSPD